MVPVGLLCLLIQQVWPKKEPIPLRILYSDVPGMKVYCRDQYLGTTPLVLDEEKVRSLGLTPKTFTECAFAPSFTGLHAIHAAPIDVSFWFQPPENDARFVPVEMPWGEGIVCGNFGHRGAVPLGMFATFPRLATCGGMEMRLVVPPSVKAGEDIPVKLIIRNRGARVCAPHQQTVHFNLIHQWDQTQFTPISFRLPEEMKAIRPGEEKELQTMVPVDPAADEYVILRAVIGWLGASPSLAIGTSDGKLICIDPSQP
jgi:hypothetical protein